MIVLKSQVDVVHNQLAILTQLVNGLPTILSQSVALQSGEIGPPVSHASTIDSGPSDVPANIDSEASNTAVNIDSEVNTTPVNIDTETRRHGDTETIFCGNGQCVSGIFVHVFITFS